MTSTLLRPTATVTVGSETVKVSDGDVGLDSGSAPYGSATVTVPLVDPDDIELLDPRDDVRATIVGANDSIGDIFPVDDHFPESDVFPGQPGTSRTFDMGLRSREVDHKGKTITLELATDEAILMDYATLVVDSGARAHEASLRAVCDYVLGKIGASLEAGTWDADVTARWPVTNAVLNALCDTTAGFTHGTNADSLAAETSPSTPVIGAAYCYWRSISTGDSYIDVQGELSVDPGATVRASAWFASGSAVLPNARVMVRVVDDNGITLQEVHGNTVATGAVFQKSALSVVAGQGAAKARLFLQNVASALATQSCRFDAPMLYVDVEDVEEFSGSSTDSDTYTFSWAGDVENSASVRTPVVDRPRDLFTWKPGVTAWDFLEPFTSAAGLRLFCDETRTWRLINPAEYEVPGRVSVAGWNATEGTDRVDRSDPNVWCTGVVVHYTWRDDNGVQQEAFDHAGTPGRVLVWEYDRPYPGPGAAAAILTRRSGAGRRQDVTALSDWTVTPGVEASITLPATVAQIGTMQSVRWQLTDALMRVGTSGLIDAVPGSWLAWDPDEAWEDVDPGLEWEDA